MGGFDAGALLFKIQAVGAQIFTRDMAEADRAVEKTGRSMQGAAKQTDELGNSTDQTGKKARATKGSLDEQAKATKGAGEEAARAKPKQEDQAKASERQAETAQKLSVALLAAGVAVGALVGLSVAKFAEFDQGMSQVAAATMATAEEQRDLADAALEAGADTAYSAREAAGAQEELAKAGISTSQIIGGALTGSLALAAAGQLEVARSATIMATTLKQFKLPAEQARHVSDLLAAGAGKAQGSVDDLALALQYVGPVAAGLGLSLEETTGTLALFAEQGQLGERAGTGLRGVLMALTAPSALAAKTMQQYNVEIFDGQGRMKSLAAVSQELKRAFGNLTEAERSEALGRIFGNEQITAARVLYEGGAEAVNKWTDEVNDSGYAAEQAAMRQDNLAGDLEKLGGAFDTALIKTGSGANDVLRDMVQSVTALVDWYGELPEPVQATALVLGVGAAAMLLFSGSALGAVSRFAELKATLEAANISLGKTAFIAAGVGAALTAMVAVVGMIATAQAEAQAKAEAYADTLAEGTNRVTKATRELAKENLAAKRQTWFFESDSAFDAAERLGISLDLVTDAAMGAPEALKQLRTELAESVKAYEEAHPASDLAADAARDLTGAVIGEAGSIEEAIRVAEQKTKVTEEGVPVTQSAAEAYLDAAGGAEELGTQLDQLIDKILEANGIGQDAISANIDYQNALAKVDEQIQNARDGVEGYALTLDTNTQAGRDNMDMLVGLADQSQQAAEKQFALDGNTANYKATLEAGKQALIDRATQLGMNADEAAALADQIYRIPSDTEWKLIAQTAEAAARLDKVITTYDGRTITYNVKLNERIAGITSSGGITYADGGHFDGRRDVKFFASGGENHVAQFARAGSYRVWAEDETEGEWYYPEAPSKRARSLQLAEKMLAGWGYSIVPAGAGSSRSSGGGRPGVSIVQHFHGVGLNADQITDKAAQKAVEAVEERLR